MKTVLQILTFFFILSCMPVAATAHNALDKTIKSIEQMPNIEYVAYNERRNPKTKKIYKSSKVIVIPSSQEYLTRQLMTAFKSDSKDAVSFSVTNNGMIYSIEFVKGKEKRRYTLVRNDGRGNSLLTVEYTNSENAPDRPRSTGRADNEDYEFDFDEDPFDFDVKIILAELSAIGPGYWPLPIVELPHCTAFDGQR